MVTHGVGEFGAAPYLLRTADAPLGEGETEGLDRRGGALAAADQRSRRAMTLLADLEQFASDHRAHGGLTADATAPAGNGNLRTVACSCGVLFGRWITPEDAEFDLLRAASLN